MPTQTPSRRLRRPAHWAAAGLAIGLAASACAPARAPGASAPGLGSTTTSTSTTSSSEPASGVAAAHSPAGPAGGPPGESAGAAAQAAARALLTALKGSRPEPEKRWPGGGTRAGGTAPALSPNWAGYVDDNSTGRTYTAVSASWVQPAVACSAAEDSMVAFWVGLDGYSSSTVEQDGTLGWCYNGDAYYYSWWEMYPGTPVVTVGPTVQPGDHITASVSYAAGAYALQVTDTTNPANSFQTSQVCGPFPCTNTSAEWIAETPDGPRGLWPWPSFGTWNVAGAKAVAGRTTGSVTSFPSDRITLVGADGQTLAATGDLTGSASAFPITWRQTY